MRVKAKKAILYKREIIEAGQEFEIDLVSYEVYKNHGWIVDMDVVVEEEVVNVDEGIPPLDKKVKKRT